MKVLGELFIHIYVSKIIIIWGLQMILGQLASKSEKKEYYTTRYLFYSFFSFF